MGVGCSSPRRRRTPGHSYPASRLRPGGHLALLGHEVGPRAREPLPATATGARPDARAAPGPVAPWDCVWARASVTTRTRGGPRRAQVRPVPRAGQQAIPSAATARRSLPQGQRVGRAARPVSGHRRARRQAPPATAKHRRLPLREVPRPQAAPARRAPRTAPRPPPRFPACPAGGGGRAPSPPTPPSRASPAGPRLAPWPPARCGAARPRPPPPPPGRGRPTPRSPPPAAAAATAAPAHPRPGHSLAASPRAEPAVPPHPAPPRPRLLVQS